VYYYPSCGVIISPTPAPKKDEGTPKKEEVIPKKDKDEPTSAPATISVSLPADATLTIDGAPTTSTSAQRLFVSPALPAGQIFHYNLKATVMRDGAPVSVEERVAVRAGQQSRITLSMPGTGVASR
jgi:uncharacterized protein (TIGR03000 family)